MSQLDHLTELHDCDHDRPIWVDLRKIVTMRRLEKSTGMKFGDSPPAEYPERTKIVFIYEEGLLRQHLVETILVRETPEEIFALAEPKPEEG